MKRTALAIGLVLALQPQPGAAVFRFLAFGDSITRSDGCPVDCSGVFDEKGLGGYVGRLEDRLGAGYEVKNRGKGGEITAQGLSRIDDVLAGGGDVLLLMEGTNDIWNGISAETAKTNLGKMIDKATDAGIDSVIATIIRRIDNPGHGPTRDLATKIRTLAGNKNRDLVDPYQPLCPNQSCFDAHYYQPDQDIGHVDASGYEIMTDLFEEVIRADTEPEVATVVGPTGDTDGQPTYVWNEVAGANWYQLEVDDATTTVIDELFDAGVICSDGSCSATPETGLATGPHTWRVRGRNLIAYGPWSASTAFDAYATVPGAASGEAPSGDFYDLSPIPFTFEWTAAADATGYRLIVDDSHGRVLTEEHSAAVCIGTSCSVTPATSFGAEDYRWQVRGTNPAGDGPWSQALDFSLYDSPPAAANLIYPYPELFDSTPTYRWDEVPGATDYTLEVRDNLGTVVFSVAVTAASCAAGQCAFEPGVELSPGDYVWGIEAENPLGLGPGSMAEFTVLACEAPLDVQVSPQVITGLLSIKACGTITAGAGVTVSATGTLELHAGEAVILDDGLTVEGGLSIQVDLD